MHGTFETAGIETADLSRFVVRTMLQSSKGMKLAFDGLSQDKLDSLWEDLLAVMRNFSINEVISAYPDASVKNRHWIYLRHWSGTPSMSYINAVTQLEKFCGWVPVATPTPEGEKSGGSVDYYKVQITSPTSHEVPYMAECNDIIEALGMNYAEGNVFKALWRSCAERTLGKKKAGSSAVYDAEKMVFFSERVLQLRKANS